MASVFVQDPSDTPIILYKYEPFSYTIKYPYQQGATCNANTLADTSSFLRGFCTVTTSNVVFAGPDGFQVTTTAPAGEPLVIRASVGSVEFLPPFSNSVFVYPGRFSNPVTLSNILYVNEFMDPVSFDTATSLTAIPFSTPTLPTGLGFSQVDNRHFLLSGAPRVQSPATVYKIIGNNSGLGHVVTTNYTIQVAPERVKITPTSGTVPNMTVGTPVTPVQFTGFRNINNVGLTYTNSTSLPDGLYFADFAGVPHVLPFTPVDVSLTLQILGTPTLLAASTFSGSNISSSNGTITARRTTGSTTINTVLPVTYSFGETVLFDKMYDPVTTTLYSGQTYGFGSNALRIHASTFFSNASSTDASMSIIAPVLPAGLSLTFSNPSLGYYLSGTPTVISSNSYTFTASNRNGFTRISNVGIPVLQDVVTLTAGQTDTSFAFVVSRDLTSNLTGYYPSNITFRATSSIGIGSNPFVGSNLPAGVSIQTSLFCNVATATLVGVPTTVTPSQTFSITAFDGIASNTLTRTVSVCNDVFTFSSNPMLFIQNVPISNQQFSATTLSGRQVQTYSSLNPPLGLSFSSAGVLSGTPLQDGSGNFIVNATTGVVTGTNAYAYTILPDQILFVQPQNVYNNVFDVPITPIQVVAASYSGNAVNPFTLSNNAGTGLIISQTGVLSGTIPSSLYSNNPIVRVDAFAGLVDGSTSFTVVTDVPRLDVSLAAVTYPFLTSGLQTASSSNWLTFSNLNLPLSSIGATGNFYDIVSNSNVLLAAGDTFARSGLTFNWSNVLTMGTYTSIAVEPGTSNIHMLQSLGTLSELVSSDNGATWSNGPDLGLPSYSSNNVYRRQGGIVRYGGGTLMVGGGSSNVARRTLSGAWSTSTIAPGIGNVYDLAYDASANRWVAATSVVDVSTGLTNGFVGLGNRTTGDPVSYSADGLNWAGVNTSSTVAGATDLATDGFGNWATNGVGGVMMSSGTPSSLWFAQTTNYQGYNFPTTFDVRFGNSTFFLFGSNSSGSARIWYSDDYGAPTWYWQSATLLDSNFDVMYGGDNDGQKWVAYGFSNSSIQFMSAPFGQGSNLEWSSNLLLYAGGDFALSDTTPGKIRYNPTLDKWVLVGEGSDNPVLLGTPTGLDVNWTTPTITPLRSGTTHYSLRDVAYSPQQSTWAAVGTATSDSVNYYGAMLTSVDGGSNWNEVSVSSSNYASNINRILWTGGTWVFSGTDGVVPIQLAFNNVNTMYRLTDKSQPSNTNMFSLGIDSVTNPHSNVTSVFYSSDDSGATWTPQAGVSGYSATRVVHSNGLWMGAGYTIDSPTGVYAPVVYTSTDGNTWTDANAFPNYAPAVGNADVLTTIQSEPGGWIAALRTSNAVFTAASVNNTFYTIDSNLAGPWTATIQSQSSSNSTVYFNQILSSNRYFPTGLPFPSIQFQPNTGGPTFVDTELSYTYYEYVPIIPIQLNVTSIDGYVYFFCSPLPVGLTFNNAAGDNLATISGTPCRLMNNYFVTIYAKDSTGTSSITLRISVILPRVVKVQDGAGSYTALVRQYTEVNADQNALDNVVYPAGASPGTFQSSYPPDEVSATIPANCKTSC